MKYLILLIFALSTTLGFSQDTGMVVGKVLDKELNNEPLVFASVNVKGTSATYSSDVTGLFLIENLADGKHTLVCSFPGYESKEFEVEIVSGQPTEIDVALNARQLQLATASVPSSHDAISKKEAKASSVLN